jgi:hypothetical protein
VPKEFREGCLSFQYPDSWQMEREDTEDGWTVTLYSTGTAFLTLTLNNAYPEADLMAETVLEVMREEYQHLEADPSSEHLAGQWAVGHDVNFISLDLTNTCWTRGFDTPDGTVLLLCQAADFELPQQEPILRAICASLQVENEDGE